MSSFKEDFGKIYVKKCEFELEIHNFFSYSEEDSSLNSEYFPILGNKCYLSIFPNGLIQEKSNDYVSLHLHLCDGEFKETVELRLGIKSANNIIVYERREVFTIHEYYFNWEISEFIKRSDLLQKKSYLVPSDILTIACTVMVKNGISDLDSSKYAYLMSL